MSLKSLINIPLGFCRMNQRYAMDIKDFLLVEIFLCILLIVLTKSVFEVKLSKLRFAITQTENAAKYLSFTKEDFVRRNAFFSRRFGLGKITPKKSSVPSDLDKAAHLANMSSVFFNTNLKTPSDYKSNSYLNSSASDSCGSNANSCTEKLPKGAVEPETKKKVIAPTGDSLRKEDSVKMTPVSALKRKSQTGSLDKGKVISAGAFTVKSSLAVGSDPKTPGMSKMSKSLAHGLNSTGHPRHTPSPSAKSNSVNVVKSFSQALTPPGNSPRLTPVKALRNAIPRGGVPDKAFKSKSQDLWASHLKR